MNNETILKLIYKNDYLYNFTCKVLDRHKSLSIIEYKLKALFKSELIDTSAVDWDKLVKSLINE